MTHKELSQVYHLNKEIEMYVQKLEELNTMYYTSPKITGLPNSSNVTDITAKLAADKEYYKYLLQNCITRRTVELERLMEFINSIPDAHIRQIFHLRHVEGMTWEAIADELKYYGSYAESTVRKQYMRYLKKCPKFPINNVL